MKLDSPIIRKRLSKGWGTTSEIKELPEAGSKWKFSGEDMPMATVIASEPRTGTLILKVPATTCWGGRGYERTYVSPETYVLRLLPDSKWFEVLLVTENTRKKTSK